MVSLLDIVAAADNFPYPTSKTSDSGPVNRYVPFYLTAEDYFAELTPIGLLQPDVMLAMEPYFAIEIDYDQSTPLARPLVRAYQPGPSGVGAVYFAHHVVRDGLVPTAMDEITSAWKEKGLFPRQLGGQKTEKCALYTPSTSSMSKSTTDSSVASGEIAFTYLRPSGCMFGFKCHGVHLTVYEGDGDNLKIWVAKRSATKRTWPGKLDSTVGGGVPAGLSMMQSIVKECEEEASFPAEFVEKHIKSTGVATFFMRQLSDGALFPMLDYTYDIQLPAQDDLSYLAPKTNDDEVDSFQLMSSQEVVTALKNDEFSPEAGALMMRFLVKHGVITVDNEIEYDQLAWRLQRNLDQSLKHAAGQAVPPF